MKIGIISDSHDRLPTLEKALRMFKEMKVDMLLHAGDFIAPFAAKMLVDHEMAPDVPLHVIYGNNDGERAGLKKILPQLEDGPYWVEADGKKIVMHHWIEWFKDGETDGADMVLSGHTHQIVNEVKDGVLYLNPGECCGWVTGRATVAVLDTTTMQAEIIDIPC